MKINQLISNETIANMNPCSGRHDNYLKHYCGQTHSLRVFLALEEITYSDKVWVVRRLLIKNQVVRWAILCAESVLSIYENKYPGNTAPRAVIEYLKSLDSYDSLTTEQINTIRELRRAVAAAAAAAAADAADAAAYAADAAAYAADAADAATAADAAYAAYAAADAATAADAADAAYAATAAAKTEQQNLNLQFLLIAVEASEEQ